jgi:CO dehydrogenase maturation factor
MGELSGQGVDEVTIVDMEASIEHLTRGTVRNVDLLLVVTEPYFRSLETAGRIAPLARELGIPRVAAIANKLRTPRDEEAVRAYCAAHDLDVIAAVPFDEAVTEADAQGRALLDHAPEAAAVRAVAGLAGRLGLEARAGV